MVNAFESEKNISNYFPDMTSGDLVLDQNGQSNSGKSGRSVRMHERVTKPTLSELELKTYLREYSGYQLYNHPSTIPAIDGYELFGEDTNLIWDFGCGRGERIVELAKQNSDKKYVGADIHYTSLTLGIRAAADAELDNVRFIKADGTLLIPYMPTRSAEAVAVMFPAPVPKSNGDFKGMPTPEFATQIHRILEAKGSPFEFASDSEPYFNYRMRQLGRLCIFSCDTEELKVGINISTNPTRYQHLWESKGIPTFSATLRKI
jgi:tRNA (guanine-N7-)-methyltransferase